MQRPVRQAGAVAAWLAVSLAFLMVTISAQSQPVSKGGSSNPAPRPTIKRVAVEPGISVGQPAVFDNLAVFPVFAAKQQHIGEFTTLPRALKFRRAEVRERSGGAQVNSVVIENKGDKPILVLAGTIIKGGNQDRLIGQDFVISKGQTVPVDAFCVEQGRWQGTRKGQATAGKFAAMGTLASRKVRAAGQFKTNQNQVWSEVAKVNAAHSKKASTGTLLATIDDKTMGARRKKLAGQARSYFAQQPDAKQVVGMAYAIDGKVKGVRWFMNHQLFGLYAEALLETAAQEALTLGAVAKAQGKRQAAKPVAPKAVAQFVKARKKAKRTVNKATGGSNVNEYQFSDEGYGSRTKYKASPKAPPRPISAEFL